jgi:hypothetical protein
MSQLPLVRDVGRVGDELDRFYTPPALAELCVGTLHKTGLPRTVLEPSLGAGAFARAARKRWPGANVIGFDVDPLAPGRADVDAFMCGDFPREQFARNVVDIVIGNPPFTGAIAHVRQALHVGWRVGLILPWSYLGGVERWRPLMTGQMAPYVVHPIAPRPWGDVVRETAFFIWTSSRFDGMPRSATTIGHVLEWK